MDFNVFGSLTIVILICAYFYQKFQPPPKPAIVGIDLGTTFSSIGTFHAGTGEVDIYILQKNLSSIPSTVYIGNEVYIGYEAYDHAIHDSQNLFYDSKRFIGRNFTTYDLLDLQKHYSFKFSLSDLNKINFHTSSTSNISTTSFSPEQVSSYILQYLIKSVSVNISRPIKDAVIAVPTEFDEHQINATIKAASLVGINVLRVITEPTAAALSYGLHMKKGVEYIIVVDVGGGTTDVSLLSIQGGMFVTHALSGNNRLGGQDFNENLENYLLRKLGDVFRSEYVPFTLDGLQEFKKEVEICKIVLNKHLFYVMNLSNTLFNLKDEEKKIYFLEKDFFSINITRNIFESVNEELFNKILMPISTVLNMTQLNKEEIDEVVLVGGSTLTPRIQVIISNYFGGKRLHTSDEPQLAVVKGTSMMAGILGEGWPIRFSATEYYSNLKKVHTN